MPLYSSTSPYVVPPTYGASPVDTLIKEWSEKEEEARAANIKRAQAIESIFDEIIARYGPEGTYGKAAQALLEKQKVRDVGAVSQTDISRGLYGIRPYGEEWEATVGAPARLKLEDIKMERLSQAQLGKAGFMERIEEPYPDYGMLASLIGQGTQASTGGTVSGPGYTITTGGSSPRTTGLSERWQAEWEQFKNAPRSYGGTTTVTKGELPKDTKGELPKDLYKWYRAGFGSPEEYEKLVGRPGAGAETISESSSEYQRYLNTMKSRQPGAVTATPSQYATIQKTLKKKYPTYGTFTGGGGGTFRGYGATGSW